MEKAINRDKVVSVKMSQRTYDQFNGLAKRFDMMTSTMAYLIIRKYLSDHADEDMQPSDFDLL